MVNAPVFEVLSDIAFIETALHDPGAITDTGELVDVIERVADELAISASGVVKAVAYLHEYGGSITPERIQGIHRSLGTPERAVYPTDEPLWDDCLTDADKAALHVIDQHGL